MANFTVNFATGETHSDPSFVAPSFELKTKMVVSARQARLALNNAGMLEAVEAAIAESSKNIQLTWEYATEIQQGDPILAAIAERLGLTKEQMDDLFRLASTL